MWDSECLLETIEGGVARLATAAEVSSRLKEAARELILCGHSHLPRRVRALTGKLIVNPGSVGMQACTHDDPEYHIMETGSPDARCAVMETDGRNWLAQLLSVPCETRLVVELAKKNGRPEWVFALATGYFTSDGDD
jgi:hypothetical protein